MCFLGRLTIRFRLAPAAVVRWRGGGFHARGTWSLWVDLHVPWVLCLAGSCELLHQVGEHLLCIERTPWEGTNLSSREMNAQAKKGPPLFVESEL